MMRPMQWLVVLLVLSALVACDQSDNQPQQTPDGDKIDSDVIEQEGEPDKIESQCTSGQTTCWKNTLYRCNKNGVWDFYKSCEACVGQRCVLSTPDGDLEPEEPECAGPCDPETTANECVRWPNICTCDPETGMKKLEDCNDICKEMCSGSGSAVSCERSDQNGADICYCCCMECESDDECRNEGKDYCAVIGGSGLCVARCDLAVASPSLACVDLGIGSGCGVVLDFDNDPACEAIGTQCTDGRICHDICGLYDSILSESCEAIPNSCTGAGELCWPLGDGQGRILDGICVNYAAECPACEADGDRTELEMVECEPVSDGDIESETDKDSDADKDQDNDKDAELDIDFDKDMSGDGEVADAVGEGDLPTDGDTDMSKEK